MRIDGKSSSVGTDGKSSSVRAGVLVYESLLGFVSRAACIELIPQVA